MIVGWIYIFFLTFLIPYASIKSGRKFNAMAEPPPKKALLSSAIVTQVFFGVIALMTAWATGAVLFPAPSFEWKDLWLALAFLVPTLGTVPMRWNWRTPEQKRKTMRRMPSGAADMPLWTLVSLCAGFFEEIAYRGVLFQLWFYVFGYSWWPAALVCSAAFALAHGVQGWRSMAVIFPMAIANHAIVLATGDLYTMMIVHAVYDFLAGLFFVYLAKKDGIVAA